ncbi:unnamed protein product [Chilo suppressalis]|uniref:Knottins-like domain-containing protein n=1 Tax=Chilo suppressalis TaxID=168631 RepID=A0ABN8ASM8_CHISP|nr:unnamed protein product [Chilo suppressalis]
MTMLSKVVIALVCLCVVKAAAFTIKSYEDDDKYEKTSPVEDISLDTSLRSCVNSQCNAVCRRLGFARGACVSANTCRCSGRLASDVTLDDVKPDSPQDDNLALSSPVEDVSLDTSLRSCVNSQCNAVCRRLGFARGACVSTNTCRCSGRLASDVTLDDVKPDSPQDDNLILSSPVEDVSLDTSLRSCVNSQCNAVCRRLGFARGACVSANTCRCSGRLASDVNLDDVKPDSPQENQEVADTAAPKSCNLNWCNQTCRRMGYRSGVCVNGRCKCDLLYSENPLLALSETDSENQEVADTAAPKSCNLNWCNQTCRRMGYRSGVCVNGRCKCDLLYSENPLLALSETDSDTTNDNEVTSGSQRTADTEGNEPINNEIRLRKLPLRDWTFT